MKNKILIFLMMFLCLQVNAQQRRRTVTQRRATTSVKKSNPQAIKKTREVGEDGFIWYHLQKGNLYGAADIEGNIIIPIMFSRIFYNASYNDGCHFFIVRLGDFCGIYSRLGKPIISPNKKLTMIYFRTQKSKGNSFLYFIGENNFGERGIYDAKGNEVVAPDLYETLELYQNPYRKGSLIYIKYKKNNKVGAYDLNGHKIVASNSIIDYYITVYPDKIELDDYNSGTEKFIYGSYSEDTRFDYDNYDGLYSPFKSYESSSSSSSSSLSSSSSSSSKSSSSSSGSTVSTRPLQPVQEWNPCIGCGGTGLCTYCQGKGKRWYGNSYENCVTCHGSMYCQQCYGRKGYYTTVYR